MRTPDTYRDWPLDGQVIRSVTNGHGETLFVRVDIFRAVDYIPPRKMLTLLLGPIRWAYFTGTRGRARRLEVISLEGIAALLRIVEGPKAEGLGRWLTSVVMPALRRRIESEAHDPILAQLAAWGGLRAAQIAGGRDHPAHAREVQEKRDVVLALCSPAGGMDLMGLMAWFLDQARDRPATGSRMTRAPQPGEVRGARTGEAVEKTPVGPEGRSTGVVPEGCDEDLLAPGHRRANAPVGLRSASLQTFDDDNSKVPGFIPNDPAKAHREASKVLEPDVEDGEPAHAPWPQAEQPFEEPPTLPRFVAFGPGMGQASLRALAAAELSRSRAKRRDA